MAEAVRLALVWHMHQPSYRDALTGQVLLPWTRLHATKDYRDMVAVLGRHPRVRATFNLTPVLLDQLEGIAAGESDNYLELARKPAASLRPEEQRFIARHFFSVNAARMIAPHARFRELHERVAAPPPGSRAHAQRPLSAEELRDLQTWFHLAWVDPEFRDEEPLRSLFRKGRGFTEAEKLSLLDWGVACAAKVVEAYRSAALAGQIEITTSAYHHPILPLLLDSDAPRDASTSIPLPSPPYRAAADAAEQLRRARESHARRFGSPPRGTWPPEGAVNQATLELLREQGFEWAASDETVLARALGRAEPGGEGWAGALYRPYRVETSAGPIAMVFRDRALSDLIGFTYMEWEAGRAAEDFVRRVLEAGARARAEGTADPLVTVILDGENCWETYPDDGWPFLKSLYARLAEDPRIEPITVGDALERIPPRESLRHVPLGSWIDSDLGVWIGHAEKNHAWNELRRARECVEAARTGGELQAARVSEAYEEILAAEASDWFWWYGEDHQSAHKDEFDSLFRAHLIRCMSLLGRPAPPAIRRSLRRAGAEVSGAERLPFVPPQLDGRETHFYEWQNAQLFDVASEHGADHRGRSGIRRVLFGLNETDLFVRVDGVGEELPEGDAVRLRFSLPCAMDARVPLMGPRRGSLAWSDPVPPESRATEEGAYAIESLLEIRVPLARLQAAPGSVVRWRVELEASGAAVEVIPRGGSFDASTLDADFSLRNWSVT